MSVAIYRDLALVDLSGGYEEAMRSFPIKRNGRAISIVSTMRHLSTSKTSPSPAAPISHGAGRLSMGVEY